MAAARAGYKVAAFDIFNDVETRRFCFYSDCVAYRDGGFDAADLLLKLDKIDPAEAVVVYGSGLENQPELLEKIAGRYAVSGNESGTVARLKSPRRFFSLLDELGIAYPETSVDAPPDPSGWLAKAVGGSGGTHIRQAGDVAGGYYQRRADGISASILFLADGKNVEVVGFNEQWLAPSPQMPFRYGGAVGNAGFPREIEEAMATAARKVVAATGLRGLNSMDFVLTSDGPLALEVNPRLSASFDLYDIPDLFERHLQACRGVLAPFPALPADSSAHLIYYTDSDLAVEEKRQWPQWVTDLPPAGTLCEAGEPVCTVHARAADANMAKQLAFARARQLDAQLHPSETTGKNP